MSENFLILSKPEFQNKLKFLSDNKMEIIIWSNLNISHTCKVIGFDSKKSESITIISECDFSDNFFNSNLKIYFQINSIKYLAKIELNKSSKYGHFIIKIIDKIYRHEKRKQERLMTFPQYKVYIKANFGNQKEENVVSIAHAKKDPVFDKLINLSNKNKIPSKMFRCLDISSAGASFISNQIEKDYILNLQDQIHFSIDFNGIVFPLKNTVLSYSVDYIDPRAKMTKMYKFGITFSDNNQSLNDLINNYIGDDTNISELENEFDKFIS